MKLDFLFFLLPFMLISCTPNHSVMPTNCEANSTKEASRIQILNLADQNISLLPNKTSSERFDPSLMIAKRFKNLNLNAKQSEFQNAFWAFDSYRYSEKNPFYSSNFHKISKEWFEQNRQNANQSAFLSLSRLAITTTNTAMRNFPTSMPLFYNPQKPGEGYPFDYLQESTLSIGFVLFVSHLSADGAWALVFDDDVWGWVKVDDIRFITKNEALAYKNSKFLSILEDKTPVYNKKGWFLFYARIGTLLPYKNEDLVNYYGEIYSKNGKEKFKIPKSKASKYPLELNDKNLRQMIASLLGEPYGWGGKDNLRDCSLLTKDLLGSFGLWLPRNSKSQALIGERIELDGLSNDEKKAVIKEKAIAYRTLFFLPGHIMLYVGIKNGEPLALHDIWGLKTKNNGRAVIGGIAITTLDIGKDLDFVESDKLLLSRIKSMSILGEEEMIRHNFISPENTLINVKNPTKMPSQKHDFPNQKPNLNPALPSQNQNLPSQNSNLKQNLPSQNALPNTQNSLPNSSYQKTNLPSQNSNSNPALPSQNPNLKPLSPSSQNDTNITKQNETLIITSEKMNKASKNNKTDKNVTFGNENEISQLEQEILNDNDPCQNTSENEIYTPFLPLGSELKDTGRCRNYETLGKIYGKNETEVEKNLVNVVWLRDFGAKILKFNNKNGAATALQDVSDELNELAKKDHHILKFLRDSGTFFWRKVAGTDRLSMHSYGAAIDINVANSSYWQWHKKYFNNLPKDVVDIFEKHKFIWGGRWEHFDTMHFEYRPEIF
ncbi:MAG: SH3 domain-containing protein [Campylobacter sp.]|nr:SH3 domain-containing protein [Campylobacter sp.]